MQTKGLYPLNMVHKFVEIGINEHLTFTKKIHLPGRWDISRCWLKSMIIAQVCLGVITIEGPSKMCSSFMEHDATEAPSFSETPIAKLTAGILARSVAHESNVHFSTITHPSPKNVQGAFYMTSFRQTCAIFLLFHHYLDLPHLPHGWIILAKFKYLLILI